MDHVSASCETSARKFSRAGSWMPAKRWALLGLDFYADWCVTCKEMERFTFSDDKVRRKMSQMVLLQADVTRSTPDDAALLKRFSLFGPPGIIFFDRGGRELPVRVIGYQGPEKFLATLDKLERQ